MSIGMGEPAGIRWGSSAQSFLDGIAGVMRERRGLTPARAVALLVVLSIAAMGGAFTVLAVIMVGIPVWAVVTLVKWQRANRA